DAEANVVSRTKRAERRDRAAAELDAAGHEAARVSAARARDVAQIRGDAHRGPHRGGAATDEERRAERATFDFDRVEHAGHARERFVFGNERRVNAELDAVAEVAADR